MRPTHFILAFLCCIIIGVGIISIIHNSEPNQGTRQDAQQRAIGYVCSKSHVEYIIFDWRTMQLHVDQEGNPVRCTYE